MERIKMSDTNGLEIVVFLAVLVAVLCGHRLFSRLGDLFDEAVGKFRKNKNAGYEPNSGDAATER